MLIGDVFPTIMKWVAAILSTVTTLLAGYAGILGFADTASEAKSLRKQVTEGLMELRRIQANGTFDEWTEKYWSIYKPIETELRLLEAK